MYRIYLNTKEKLGYIRPDWEIHWIRSRIYPRKNIQYIKDIVRMNLDIFKQNWEEVAGWQKGSEGWEMDLVLDFKNIFFPIVNCIFHNRKLYFSQLKIVFFTNANCIFHQNWKEAEGAKGVIDEFGGKGTRSLAHRSIKPFTGTTGCHKIEVFPL